MQYPFRAAIAVLAVAALSGCTVIAVGAAATSLVVGAGSLAVDAAVGTAKITGAAVGLAADAVLPSSDPER